MCSYIKAIKNSFMLSVIIWQLLKFVNYTWDGSKHHHPSKLFYIFNHIYFLYYQIYIKNMQSSSLKKLSWNLAWKITVNNRENHINFNIYKLLGHLIKITITKISIFNAFYYYSILLFFVIFLFIQQINTSRFQK